MSKITEPGEPAISANGVDRRGAKIDLREWMQTDPMEQLRKDRENELAAMEPEDRKRLLSGRAHSPFRVSGASPAIPREPQPAMRPPRRCAVLQVDRATAPP